MSTFFEKLKKGVGVEVPEEKREEKPKIIQKENKPKKMEIKIEKKPIEAEESLEDTDSKEKKWFEPEGELAVDVYQTDQDFVIQTTIAGIKPEDLNVCVENDVITMRGNRKRPEEKEEKSYFYQECYWGFFSRQIISPVEIDASRAQASLKEGILTIRIPKIEREKKRKIEVKE